LVLQSFEKQEQSCSKVFIVGESSQGKITGKLQAIASPENPFDYTFVLQDLQTQ
jgi:hypothetical protein